MTSGNVVEPETRIELVTYALRVLFPPLHGLSVSIKKSRSSQVLRLVLRSSQAPVAPVVG